MLRFPRRLAARFGALVRADPSGVRAGFGALLISSGGDLVAGITLGSITHTLDRLPGLLVLVPAAIGMRGNVFGGLGSRLGTLIHTGTFRVSRRLSTPVGQNVAAALILSLSTSFALAVLAKAIAVAFNEPSITIVDFMVVAVVGAVLSSLVVLAITVGVASQCAQRRWDLDNVAAPIVTAAGDVATLPSLFVATYLLGIHLFTPIVAGICAIACIVALVAGLRSGLPILRRIVIESAPVLVMAGFVDVLAGVTIEKRTEAFLAFPALIVLIPPFLEDSGALGGILSARVSTRLHLGTLARGRSPLAALDDVLLVLVYALPTFVLLGGGVGGRRGHGHGVRRRHRLLRGRVHAPPRPRPRQLRDPDRHVDPGPVRRVLAYPCHRARRPSLATARTRPADLMDDQPRNLKSMLSEAKDASELMVDLGYASLFFDDEDMADEVLELEERLNDLVHEMRSVCVLAARSPRDADAMSGVLHLISAIERMGNAAVDIAKIVTHHLGIPAALVADLAAAQEISHRVRVREDSALAQRTLDDAELPTETGLRVVAIRRAKEWLIDPEDDEMLRPGDVLIVRGSADGIPELRVLAGAPEWREATLPEDTALGDLDRAVDVLVEMKDVSEAAVGLAYSALLFNDQGLAAEVSSLENRLDEMRERLELWVLRGAAETVDPSALRGLLHLGGAAEEIGDAAQQMVWLVEEGEELHPVLNAALGDTDDVIMRVPVAPGSELEGEVLNTAGLGDDTGFHLLALHRNGRYFYRPRLGTRIEAGDELVASGPWEGREELARQAGFRLISDGDTGEMKIVRVGARDA
jgi:uncharacterized protein with PhoU and TrkA domain/cation transporter-like permease